MGEGASARHEIPGHRFENAGKPLHDRRYVVLVAAQQADRTAPRQIFDRKNLRRETGELAHGASRCEVEKIGLCNRTQSDGGREVAPGTPAEFAAFIASESARLKKLVELTGIRMD